MLWRILIMDEPRMWTHVYVNGNCTDMFKRGFVDAISTREQLASRMRKELLPPPSPRPCPLKSSLFPSPSPPLSQTFSATSDSDDEQSEPPVLRAVLEKPTGPITQEALKPIRYWSEVAEAMPVHVHLECPTAVQLYELVNRVPTERWRSLHINLGKSTLDRAIVEGIFSGARFSNLRSLRIDENASEGWVTDYDYWSLESGYPRSRADHPVSMISTWRSLDDWRGQEGTFEGGYDSDDKYHNEMKVYEPKNLFCNNADLPAQSTQGFSFDLVDSVSKPTDYFSNTSVSVVPGFPIDPFCGLYDAILASVLDLCELHVDADLTGVASQYGLFSQRIQALGGSLPFVSSAVATVGSENCIRKLVTETWDVALESVIPNLTQLTKLQVDHYPDAGQIDSPAILTNARNGVPVGLMSILLPSLEEITLTNHSVALLSKICSASLMQVTVTNYKGQCATCPPFSHSTSHFFLDKWSCANVHTASFYVPVNIQSILTFFRAAFTLRNLTVTTPDPNLSEAHTTEQYLDWKSEFVGKMTENDGSKVAKINPADSLVCCPQLETLTILVPGKYVDDEWVSEAKKIYEWRRQGGRMKTLLLKFEGDGRQADSGPSNVFF